MTAIAEHCRQRGWPLLPVLVVNQDTRLPSTAAAIYDELGLATPDQLRAEQRRCWEFDWTEARF